MARLQTAKQDKAVVLLFGPPMSGKTILASQFPNPTFVDLDGQTGSVRALAARDKLNVDFPVIPVDESETTDEDFLSLCGQRFAKQDAWIKTKQLVAQLATKLTPDETLVFDNLSRASEYLIDHLKKKNNRDALQLQDWGMYVNEMTSLVDYMHSKFTKCNCIIIGHESVTKDDMSGRLLRGLSIPTRVKERIPSKCSDYLYMTTEVTGGKQSRKVCRLIQAVPDPSNPTGSRCLIPNIENPTYAKMKPYIEAYLGRKLGEPTWTPKEGA
jgi:hypothetical protein